MSTFTYTVSGMTCAHCVASVTEEVSQVAGVDAVEVDLATGRLRLTGDQEPGIDELRAAVEEAGYTLENR
ncbi:MAG: heavy-metal-associated domain-containing protein [Actinomycetales bacterium]